MSARHLPANRAEELACDAALFGLDDADRRELDALDFDDDALLELELAAAEVAVAELEARGDTAPPLPEALVAKLLSKQPAVAQPPREEARVIPLRSERPAPSPRRDPVQLAGWLVAAAAVAVAIAGWSRRPEPVVVTPPLPTTEPTRVAVLDAGPPSVARERDAIVALAGTSRSEWKATKDDAGATATGDVVWHAGVQKGVMRFQGLQPNDPSRSQYQLWIFDETRDDKQPVDGGVFDVSDSGEVLVPIAAKLKVGKAKLFAITVERPGGVVVSKRERIVLTATPSAT